MKLKGLFTGTQTNVFCRWRKAREVKISILGDLIMDPWDCLKSASNSHPCCVVVRIRSNYSTAVFRNIFEKEFEELVLSVGIGDAHVRCR